jgi:hypothetical protein
MKPFLPILVLVISLFASTPTLAIDPGVSQGWLQIEGGAVTKLTHAYAYLERPHEMRLLLADRELSGNVLPRIIPSAVTDMARTARAADSISSGQSETFRRHAAACDAGGRAGAIRGLAIANNRVVGEIDSPRGDMFELGYAAKFSAPLFGSSR